MPGQDGSYGARLPVITIDIVRMTARTKRDGLPGKTPGVYVTKQPRTAALFAFLRVQVRKQKCKKAFIWSGFFWSERRDSNSRPPVPQTGALTGLRYAPTEKKL
jgi:hypothetical protein